MSGKKSEQATEAKQERLVNREGAAVTSFSVEGVQYDADEAGVFTVAAEHVPAATGLVGLVPAPKKAG